jgi:UDP-3-O-[3-hydroxymyristoyl] glucosamine N-acyltransferase
MAKDPSVGWTLGELASLLQGTCDGPPDLIIKRPSPAGTADPFGLSFAENDDYLKRVAEGGAAAVLAKPGDDTRGIPAIRVERPRQAFGQFLAMCDRPLPLASGVHETAVVSPDAAIGAGVSIGPYAVVEAGCRIGDGTRIYPFVYVGENCTIGARATLYPHAVLYRDVNVGDRAVIHAGVVLAADGFGFVWDGKKQSKVPQVGGVQIGEDAEIGANTTVDRATAGITKIGRGTKLDNLVQIAHNCSIGEDSVLAAFCGISGSTTTGDRCTFAGQVGTSSHVKIGSDIVLGGRTGVTKDLPDAGAYWGVPARPYASAMKVAAIMQKGPEMYDRLRALEKRVQELEESKK